MTDFSCEAIEARIKEHSTFQLLSEKQCQQQILISNEITLENDQEKKV